MHKSRGWLGAGLIWDLGELMKKTYVNGKMITLDFKLVIGQVKLLVMIMIDTPKSSHELKRECFI